MTPQQLRNSILQLAIEGKLVEQRKDIGNAESLYQQIQEEKNKLIKEGKIKREKVSTALVSEDSPFDIPDNWKWCYLGELFSHVAGKALNAKNTKGKKCKYLTTSNVYWDYFDLTNLKEMYYTEDEIEKYSVKYGDLLVLEGGDVGRSAIWNLKERYCIQNHIHRLRPYIDTCVKYFYYVMMYFKYKGNILGKGIGIKGLSARALYCIKVPLPPLEEQYRIVDKIEELFLFVKQYEAAWIKLDELNKKFPETLKKSILHGAIQGKLYAQENEDESGENLIEKIMIERKYLVETSKIKNTKALQPIQENEIPFDIPKGWAWERLGNISTYNQTKEKVKAVDLDSSTWVLDLENIEKNTGKIINYITAKDKNVRGEKVIFYKGQLLYSKLRPYLKKVLIAPDNGVCTPELVPFDILGGCNRKYILYVLKSPYVDFLINSLTYGVKMPRVSMDTMLNILIPIPSINEQNIIVEIIERLNILCDKLKH